MEGQRSVLERSSKSMEGVESSAREEPGEVRSLTDLALDQAQIDCIATMTPGGLDNIQDVYPLTPLQEGLLFHHLANREFDTYVLSTLLEFDNRNILDAFIRALQSVIDRHDILRAAIHWEKLPRPIHVINRRAALSVQILEVDQQGAILEQIKAGMLPHRQKWSLQKAPLMTLRIAQNSCIRKWYAALHVHHVICDYGSLRQLVAEIVAALTGDASMISGSAPYRDHVIRAVTDSNAKDAETFFRSKLQDVCEPTIPFGLANVLGSDERVQEETRAVGEDLAVSLRSLARRLAVKPSRVFHAAWALVVAHMSARDDVVFGTVILAKSRKRGSGQDTFGMSINTLPLRVKLRGISASELLGQVQRELTDLLRYENVSLAMAQRCAGIAAPAPLFGALLNFRRAPSDLANEWARVPGIRLVCAPEARTNYPVALTVDDCGNDFILTAQTTDGIDPRRVAGYVCTALESLVETLECAPETSALALAVMPANEREMVLRGFNRTEVVLGAKALVHELFEEQVRRTPDAVAVTHEGRQLTYSGLNRWANRLARDLIHRGVGPDVPVGICVERSLEMVIGVLGILKAGGAYVPLDPNYPTDRLQHMLDDAAPPIVLTQSELLSVLPSAGAEVIALDERLKEIASNVSDNLAASELGLSTRHLVYVIYTSGSTGRPKGTAMAHHSMVNLIEWHRSTFSESAGMRVLQFAALSFDVAFQETFSTLCTGGTLVLLDEWVRRDARALTAFLSNHSIQRLFAPPLVLQILSECVMSAGLLPQTLQDVVTAGEQLRISPEMVSLFKRLDGCRLHNHYGPTETHVVTALTLTGNPDRWPTLPAIGRPIWNAQLYVLDNERRPVPIGVAGEIYIGGAAVARGYLGKSELTAQRFIQDPFGGEPDARLYRTGDLGRWRADGTLEYLGRNDFQVKVRGYRIEPGEIEAQLARYARVKEAAVIAREDEPGQKRLIAYITLRDKAHLDVEELREHLKRVLPEYMVPAAFVVLEALPLTPNGKLDRRGLPAPDQSAYARREYEAPRGELEEVLAGIWQELLCIEPVGRNDNFFELGGHSLLIVQMLERLRRLGLSCEIRQVFGSPTLSDLAASLMRGAREIEVPPNLIPEGCERITPEMLPLVELEQEHIDRIATVVPGCAANVQDVYPLAPLQEGILFHHLLTGPGSDVYVRPILYEVSSRERLEELIAALQAIVDRHDILRTVVLWEGLPRAVQVVCRHVRLLVDSISLDPKHDAIDQLKERMKPQGLQLDLRRAPLMRVQVAAAPDGIRWYAIVCTHHLVSDNESLDVLFAELAAYLRGDSERLSEPGLYRDHVAQALAHTRSQDARAFFRGKLGDVEESTAPFGLMDVRGDGSEIEEAREELELHLGKRLRTQARRLGVTAASVFHAAWGLALSTMSGREDIVFGTVLVGRLHSSAGARRALGMFINTLPLRLRLEGLTAKELVEHTQRELVELLGYEQASLAEAQRCSAVSEAAPLFTTLLNYRHTLQKGPAVDGPSGVTRLASQGRTNYPILLSVDDRGDGFTLQMEADRRIAAHRLLGYVRTVVQSLVEALEGSPDAAALSLRVLPESERTEALEAFNPVRQPRQEQVLQELFERQVRLHPQAMAVACEGESLTYVELNAWANKLAWYLREQGVGPDRLVGICMERSIEMVVGLLGILKAGGAYVPLDPGHPAERLAYVLADAAPLMLLTQERLKARLPSNVAAISLDGSWSEIDQSGATDIPAAEIGLRPDHLAYVIYTSGSTGKPKGAMVEHRNVLMLWGGLEQIYGEVGPCERVALNAPINFDASVQQLVQLLSGRTLHLLSDATRRDPTALRKFIAQERIDCIDCTPSQLKSWLEAGLLGQSYSELSLVLVGGEAIEAELWGALSGKTGTAFYNVYGPTECTVDVTAGRVAGAGLQPHIGSPMENRRIYILSRQKQPAPIGVVGEIYVAGAGVARGYLNRPELTAECFLPDPFCADPGAKMYKTGDLGRWKDDGTIEYLGRNDEQVKIRGFRIELGEIEAQLVRHGDVKEAAVLAREDQPGEKRLVAYVIARDPGNAPAVELLREHLKGVLPEYMVPSAFVVLEGFPLTSNGKLDRRALPAPDQSAYTYHEYEAPQGQPEEILAGVWQDLLKVEQVGRNDNFFELGGHSLLIVQMLERLRRVGLSADVRRVFESSTLRELAATLMRGDAEEIEVPPNLVPKDCERITPEMLPLVELEQDHIDRIAEAVPGGVANIQDIYPLAALQEGILFHHLLNGPGRDAYVRPMLYEVSSRDRLEELIAALQAIVDRHDILRTAILWEGLPRAVQVVCRQATLRVESIALDPRRDAVEQLKERMKPKDLRLDLQQAPLVQVKVVAAADGTRWYALLCTHHLVCDNKSIDILFDELASHLNGKPEELSEPKPYRDHVAQALAYARSRDAKTFFHAKLGDVAEPTAPFGLTDVRGDGSEILEAREEVEIDLGKRLRMQARRLGVTAATVFHAAWALAVAKTSGREDVVFGTVLMGRLQGSAGAQHILGMFINTLPLRLSLEGTTAQRLVERTQRELMELLGHEQASLAEAQRCSAVSESAPLFTALLNYRHSPERNQELNGLSGVTLLSSQGRTNYPILLSVDDQREGFRLELETDRRINPQRMLRYMRTAVQSLVEALESAPETDALALQIIPASELLEVGRFNATETAMPQDKLVHELFEEQVKRSPAAVAVIYEGESLTYSELNARANQLAWHLRAKGIGPDERVGICMERSLEMVVGLLGILKAGGAYVPMDPGYPAERLAYMLADAAPRFVLIQERLRRQLPSPNAELIALDTDWSEVARQKTGSLNAKALGLRADHLAYVIYTSGSTGKPKGAMNEHRAVVNRLLWMQDQYQLGQADRVLQKTPFSFDVSVWEFFWPVMTGACLIVARPGGHQDPAYLMDLIERTGVTTLHFVPSMLQTFLGQHEMGRCRSIRHIVCSGEELAATLQNKCVERLPQAQLSNLYGPTECAVDVTSWECARDETEGRVPVGRPIANTRIYVLDRRGRALPIGVAGEVYIAGIQVGRGYLNRPELTAERFLADPFGTDSQGKMYKTGDLGKWRDDGTIEYLGRNDNQVKIRGFRIELGEIEAQLAHHPEIKDAVVMAREDTPGEKRLVGYVIPRDISSRPAAESLREYLRSILPEYMVPSAFVALETIPVTPNGKLDRKALPRPDQSAYTAREYEPPRGKAEETLAAIWQELLHIERVGRNDNFFDLGGHSLLALKLLFVIDRELGLTLNVTDVYKRPTLTDLAARIGGDLQSEELVDLRKEAQLDEEIRPHAGAYADIHSSVENNILLTGGTGFVGRFLLAELLNATDATVHCVVRARSQAEANFRVRDTLIKWDLWRDAFAERIMAVPGDLRSPGLCLDSKVYQRLSTDIDSIYHCATSMNHLETYSMARATNVDGVRELLRFAINKKTKLINYISTLGVFGAAQGQRLVDESTPIDFEKHQSSLGYTASKWVGEKILLTADQRGIPCNIFRLGLVWADRKVGRYDELQREYRLLKSCLISGYGIERYRYHMSPTPVDHVAHAVVFLAGHHRMGHGTFHISSSSHDIGNIFERCNRFLTDPLQLLPFTAWIAEIQKLHLAGVSLPIVPLVQATFSMDADSSRMYQPEINSPRVEFDCSHTERELGKAGISPVEFDEAQLRLCMEDMMMRDSDLIHRSNRIGFAKPYDVPPMHLV